MIFPIPHWGTGPADFRRDMDKPLGLAYVQENFFFKKFFGRDLEERGPTSKLASACARLVRHAQPCEKSLGFANGCAMGFTSELLQPRRGISFETFRKVAKLFRKLFNQMRSSLQYLEMLGICYARDMVSISRRSGIVQLRVKACSRTRRHKSSRLLRVGASSSSEDKFWGYIFQATRFLDDLWRTFKNVVRMFRQTWLLCGCSADEAD